MTADIEWDPCPTCNHPDTEYEDHGAPHPIDPHLCSDCSDCFDIYAQ